MALILSQRIVGVGNATWSSVRMDCIQSNSKVARAMLLYSVSVLIWQLAAFYPARKQD